MRRKEAIAQVFKSAFIIHLYRRNENPQVCDNYRGLSLLSVAGKKNTGKELAESLE